MKTRGEGVMMQRKVEKRRSGDTGNGGSKAHCERSENEQDEANHLMEYKIVLKGMQ